MLCRRLSTFLSLVVLTGSAFAQEAPDAKQIVDRMIAAAGGEAFAGLGVVELVVREDQTRNDGTMTAKDFTLIVDTRDLANMRLEYPNGTVVGVNASGGWGVIDGVMDDRPQTPTMARKTLNQTVFPLLLPYSLQMEGVGIIEAQESTLEDRDVWVLAIPFAKGFFLSPVLATTWLMIVAQDDYSILGYEFVPPVEYQKVSPVGVRYRILKHHEIEGVKLAEQILSVGISPQGTESGNTRVTKIRSSARYWEPALFLSPAQLAELEEEE